MKLLKYVETSPELEREGKRKYVYVRQGIIKIRRGDQSTACQRLRDATAVHRLHLLAHGGTCKSHRAITFL